MTALLAQAGLGIGRVRVGAILGSRQCRTVALMTGRDQSLITGVVAGEGVRWLCSTRAEPGMHYFDEVTSLIELKPALEAVGCRFGSE